MTPPLQGPAGTETCPPAWLALREPADADARSPELAAVLAGSLVASPGAVLVRDLGCGTGSMARWLAPKLNPPGGQHWVLHDRDARLLEHAVATLPARVTGEADAGDLTRLDAAALAGTALVVASALLDLLTAGEADDLAGACVAAGCPALLTLSVTGRVQLDPVDPLDAELAAAFNAHQRRRVGARRLLGPDAIDAAVTAFRRRGALVRTAAAPWRLGPDRAELVREWLAGRLDAACAQRPELAEHAGAYRDRRRRELARGRLTVTVEHTDLLAVPDGAAVAQDRP
ncbi:SAM-dependent methyltransferase [Pseudonocardia parietis]|uniref:SAM-dependent methyltransferase n=1 Tax=Pseudonocardia parietis TaxID=570936 RepID=A0ABS4VYM1_9PSEU|nr:SAM-dependent methyltransferase [Pseudonocardia parietis]MBP2368973.1 SAM-dependent methyltransferase [Pseudonocardia parietis]